eukprot:12914225-Prorocentrum_lima.AAC.1
MAVVLLENNLVAHQNQQQTHPPQAPQVQLLPIPFVEDVVVDVLQYGNLFGVTHEREDQHYHSAEE